MKRLLEQSACVHRQFNVCTFLLDSGDPCPGGTSREVTDYPTVDWFHRLYGYLGLALYRSNLDDRELVQDFQRVRADIDRLTRRLELDS